MTLFLLHETAAGYGLFLRKENEPIAAESRQLQEAIQNFGVFSKMVEMKAFYAFKTPEESLAAINDASLGVLSDDLRTFLESNLPHVKEGKRSKYVLGCADDKLCLSIGDALRVQCSRSPEVLELLRALRRHFVSFVPELKEGNLERAQLGLGHAYGRAKIKFNPERQDQQVIQSICLLDQLDKDLNTFSMRLREWFGYAFPELSALVSDHYTYALVVRALGGKKDVPDEALPGLAEILANDDEAARAVQDAARSSMGQDVSALDLVQIERFAERVITLAEYRARLYAYLQERMHSVAPNLAALIGEMVGARLISHAGSLVNLAKCPASTVQILGAEKALFRALKTRGNTPKYGLIFHSTFIGRAAAKNKGRISRYLANKCSIASRLDSFSDEPTSLYGERLREQVDERLQFYDSGKVPGKNVDAMAEVALQLKKKRKRDGDDDGEQEAEASKKSKKSKKARKKDTAAAAAAAPMAVDSSEKKAKKKKKKSKKDKKK